MADTQAKQPMEIERKIGSTTYTATSHFTRKGSSAVDKLKRLIDIDTKENYLRRKP